MAYSGAGAIWDMATGTFEATNRSGDAAGLAIAKGLGTVHILMGLGTEGITIGTFGATQSLVRLFPGGYSISRFHVADGTDPTKLLFWDAAAITTGTIRTATIPNYSGNLVLASNVGSSGQALLSNGAGVAPSYQTVAVTNALLDGVNHTDTLAGSVARGDLIAGNATPKWARLPIGTNGFVLTSNGSDPVWSASGATALEHNTLFHLKPFTATAVSMSNGATTLTTTGGQFANVRVGDRINLDDAHYNSALYGFRVTALIDTNNVTMDLTNTGGAISGATATVFPCDHFDHTLLAGILTTGGLGTFDEGANPGGTIPTCYGSFDFVGYANAGTQRYGFEGASSTSNPNGFNWKKRGSTARMFVHAQNLTANRFVSIPDLSGIFCFTAGAQNVTDKKLIGNNEIQTDDVIGNVNGSHFADVNDSTKTYYFDFTGIGTGTGKKAKWADVSAGGHVSFTWLGQATGIDGKATGATTIYTVPSGKSVVVTRVVVRCTAATAIATGPTFGIGVAAGEDDIVASAAHAAFVAANTYIFCSIKDPAVVATSTQAIKIGIDAAATGTSMTLAVELAGYLV